MDDKILYCRIENLINSINNFEDITEPKTKVLVLEMQKDKIISELKDLLLDIQMSHLKGD